MHEDQAPTPGAEGPGVEPPAEVHASDVAASEAAPAAPEFPTAPPVAHDAPPAAPATWWAPTPAPAFPAAPVSGAAPVDPTQPFSTPPIPPGGDPLPSVTAGAIAVPWAVPTPPPAGFGQAPPTPPTGQAAWPGAPAYPTAPTWPGTPPQGPPTYWGTPAMGGATPPGGMPPVEHASSSGRHRSPVLIVALCAAVAALLIGVGLGHSVWRTNTSAQANTGNSSPGGVTTPNNGGSVNGGGGFSFPGSTGNSTGNSGSSASPAANATASKVDPGLVDIDTSLNYQDAAAAGTGMVISSSGLVLTNNHVIDGATSIRATDLGNGRTYTATVVGYDRTRDVALIKLRNASGLTTVTTGDSSTVKAGQSIIGIGNAGGTGGTPSVAAGSVTAVNQKITASDDDGSNPETLTGMIQINADIQPGDSGGPLVTTDGTVVGMDTAASTGVSFSSSTNQGYAIPINTALNLVHQIESGDTTNGIHLGATAFIGVEVTTPSEVSQVTGNCSSTGSGSSGSNTNPGFNFGVGNGLGGTTGSSGSGFGGTTGSSIGSTGSTGSSTPVTSSGAAVVCSLPGSPGAKAGLTAGDVITSIDGTTIANPTALTTELLRHHPGDTVQVGYVDSTGMHHTASVTLTSGPPQ